MEKRSTFLQGDFPQHLFRNLKVFEVAWDDSACFPLGLVERLHNLEILSLHVCLYEEIFSNEGYLEQHVGIKSLHMIRLNHLKYLWKQHSKLDSVLKNRESLYVSYCKNLLNLLPSSSVPFWNLTEVHVFACEELVNLVTSSAAKGLVRLVTLRVFGCSAMT